MSGAAMRLVFICTDPVGQQMGGPGIRYWELAHALADRHDVTLVAPVQDRPSDTVTLLRLGAQPWRSALRGADAVITQYVTPPLLSAVHGARARLVVDAYVPMVLEGLQHHAGASAGVRRARAGAVTAVQNLSLLSADAVICASEQQRDLWTGALMTLGRFTPGRYDADRSLRSFVHVVPFGLPADPPVRSGPGPRALFGLPEEAVVALWGGGMWEWFDPATVVEAVGQVRQRDPRLHLVLLGGQARPDGAAGVTGAGTRAIAAATRLGLLGRGVHVAAGWVPYVERGSWLLDADIGVSAHLDVAENHYAFRTRVLDYLWAGLPCVLTVGDALADAAQRGGFGLVAPVGDVDAWVRHLCVLTQDLAARREAGVAAARAAAHYRWPVIADSLAEALGDLPRSRPPRLTVMQLVEAARYLAHGANAVLLGEGVSGVAARFASGTPGQRPTDPPRRAGAARLRHPTI